MSSVKSKAWMVMAAVEGLKDNGYARWNYPIRSLHQHLKTKFRSFTTAMNVSPQITNKIRDQKLKQSEESMRTIMYLSSWGPN